MTFKNGYREIEGYAGMTIEMAVHRLQKYNELGEKVFMEFNGTELYSDDVTVDSAYLKVLGKTKAEYDRDHEKWLEEERRKEEEHKAKIPELAKEWIEKGHAVLDEKYWDHWDEIVPIRLSDLYQGMELGMCLDLVRILNKGPEFMIEAKDVLNDYVLRRSLV